MKRFLLALLLLPAAAFGTDLSSVNVFPIPWKPGTGDPAFDAPALTFSNLPPGTHVVIFTLRGARIFNAFADAAGTLLWSGKNDYGRDVASGTYLVLFDGAGRRTTRRVVVIR